MIIVFQIFTIFRAPNIVGKIFPGNKKTHILTSNKMSELNPELDKLLMAELNDMLSNFAPDEFRLHCMLIGPPCSGMSYGLSTMKAGVLQTPVAESNTKPNPEPESVKKKSKLG